ncbi:MAG: hypothetical protein ACK5LL_16075 [Suipraeoptans sp.]
MKNNIQKTVYKLADTLELMISFIIVLAVLILSLKVVLSINLLWKDLSVSETLTEFLSTCFTIVIAIELVKMLVKHSVAIATEVLIFAVARQMVVGHFSPLEMVLCITGLLGLFFIRKHLFKDCDLTESIVHTVQQKTANIVNDGVKNDEEMKEIA